MTALSDKIVIAFEFANQLHKDQVRKFSGVPFITHLMGVAALVLEHGGNEGQVIAALLHDSVEDQGGRKTLAEIESLFGPFVAELVDDLSDSYGRPKAPWKERKDKYIRSLPEHHPDSWLVSLADKVYNARSILREHEKNGDIVWERFNGGKDGTLWYYRALADFFGSHQPGWLADELHRAVIEMDKRAAE